jgi:SsrA-binding protein
MEIINKRARFDYEILETYEAGIVLVGCEVKSIRAGNASIKESFARIKGEELMLVNMHVTSYAFGNIHNPEETRERKLLLKRSEIRKLIARIQQKGLALIPLKVYIKDNRYVKILLGLGKGKKNYDKKEVKKSRDIEREVRRSFAGRLK